MDDFKYVFSVTLSLARSNLSPPESSGCYTATSRWFKHPECSMDLWWQVLVEVGKGRMDIFLTHSTEVMIVARCSGITLAKEDRDCGVCDRRAALGRSLVLCAAVARVCQHSDRARRQVATTTSCSEAPAVVRADEQSLFTVASTEVVDDPFEATISVTATVCGLALPDLLRTWGGADAMFQAMQFSVVNLVVDSGEVLTAHKAVLAECSPVFAAAFQGTMRESVVARVTVSGVSARALAEALRFMYTGQTGAPLDDQQTAVSLLHFAQQYAVDGLKAACELALVKHVAGAEVALLYLADVNGAQFLKKVVLSRVAATSSAENVELPLWSKLIRSHPHLVEEYLRLHAASGPVGAVFRSEGEGEGMGALGQGKQVSCTSKSVAISP